MIRPAKAKMFEMSSAANGDVVPNVMLSAASPTVPLLRSTDRFFRSDELHGKTICNRCS